MAEVVKLSHTHEAIMAFMVANPTVPLKDVAAKFNFTQGWLSQLIHSSLFQAQLHYRQDVEFSEAALSVRDRLQEMAHTSLEKINERIALGGLGPDHLLASAELALKSLGFGAPKASAPTAVINNNTYVTQPVDRAILSEARAVMAQRQPLTLEHRQDEPVVRSEHSHDDRVPESSQPREVAVGNPVGGARPIPDAPSMATTGFATFGEVRKGQAAA